jgi:undecaprenyl-diphosphatase
MAIGYSRVYLGVHYPSDVLAGYLGALVWVLGVGIAYRKSL